MKKKAISTIVKGIQKVAKASAKKKAAAATKKVSSGAKTTAKTKNVRAKTGLNKEAPAAAKKVVAKKPAYKPKVGEPKPPLSKAAKKANDAKVAPKKVAKKVAKKAPAKKVAAKKVAKKAAPKGPKQGPKTAAESVKGKPIQGPSNYKGNFFKNKEKALKESQEKFMNSKGRGKAKSKSGKSARQAGYDAGKKAATGKTLKKVKKGAVKVAKSRITQGVGAGYAGAKLGSSGNGKSTNPQASKYFTEAELQAARRRVRESRNR